MSRDCGLTGYMAERLLREQFRIAPEMSDRAGIVCLVTVGDTSRDDPAPGAGDRIAASATRPTTHRHLPPRRRRGHRPGAAGVDPPRGVLRSVTCRAPRACRWRGGCRSSDPLSTGDSGPDPRRSHQRRQSRLPARRNRGGHARSRRGRHNPANTSRRAGSMTTGAAYVLSSHSGLDIGHKPATMGLFQRGKGDLRPLPTTIEHDRLSGADAGFWGASVCLARLASCTQALPERRGRTNVGSQPWEGLAIGASARAVLCALVLIHGSRLASVAGPRDGRVREHPGAGPRLSQRRLLGE